MDKTQLTQQWFTDWANDYDRTLGKIKRHHHLLDLAVRMSKVKNGERVLDIGIGTGLTTLKFLAKANCTVVGIDNSHDMMSICQGKLDKLKLNARVECHYMDANTLIFPPASFNIVVSTVTLHHVKNKLPVIKTIRDFFARLCSFRWC